jgi:hypothetical protein
MSDGSAEAGQFDGAERYQRMALQDPAIKGQDRDEFRQRLELYEQKNRSTSQFDRRAPNSVGWLVRKATLGVSGSLEQRQSKSPVPELAAHLGACDQGPTSRRMT